MRPPQFAAENQRQAVLLRERSTCFNEAAAICGGKHPAFLYDQWFMSRFNEAAAICGGKHLHPRN